MVDWSPDRSQAFGEKISGEDRSVSPGNSWQVFPRAGLVEVASAVGGTGMARRCRSALRNAPATVIELTIEQTPGATVY